MTLDMLPRPAFIDIRDRLSAEAVTQRDINMPLTSLQAIADNEHIILGQLCVAETAPPFHALWMRVGPVLIAACVVASALQGAVKVVVQERSKPEMRRIAARPIVAGMQHNHRAFGHSALLREFYAVVQLIRQAVRSLVPTAPLDPPITHCRWRGLPRPTFIGFPDRYLGPEALDGIGGSAHA